MPSIGCLNGVFSAPEEIRVPADDRGYVFGDGVYEAMAVYGGRVWAVNQHMARLCRSLGQVGINADLDLVQVWMKDAVERSQLMAALVYVQITRGVAPRHHSFDRALEPNVLLTVRPWAPIPQALRETGAKCITVTDLRWARRDIKSINLLPNVLAKQEAEDAGVYEAILVDENGRMNEGSSTNVFLVRDGVLLTPPADQHILGGVTRDFVLKLARRVGIEVREQVCTRDDPGTSQEVFLTGTTTEVLGVTLINGSTVGDGKVGPVTGRLSAEYRACVRSGKDGPDV